MKMINKKTALLSLSGAVAAALTTFAVSDLSIKTTEYELDTQKDGEELCAAVVSDLHFSRYGIDNSVLLSKIKAVKPDFIIVTGDFFDLHHGRSNEEFVKKTLSEMLKIADVYFTPGNHDLRFNAATGKDCLKTAEDLGCKIINGNYYDVIIKDRKVRIGGIFDYSVYLEDYYKNWYDSDVYKFLQDFSDTDSVKLLAMHRPNTFIYTKDEWDIDAVFCGHTHGGIWQLPLIGGVYAPEQGIFPEYDRGEFSFGKMKMFLSAGLEGYYLIPRLFNRPEILKIKIN